MFDLKLTLFIPKVDFGIRLVNHYIKTMVLFTPLHIL